MENSNLDICDYAVAFIDLLGQRASMSERHLPVNKDEAIAVVKRSVGRTVSIQKLFEQFYASYAARKHNSNLLVSLHGAVPDVAPGQLKWQFFSDGLVVYVPLGEGLVEAPANSIFGLLVSSGAICLIGLAAGSPIRAGIDVAWAVEYRPNELYGSAIAHAYDLESKVAQWPRIVVGEGLVGYLQHYASAGGNDVSSQVRRKMASICLQLLAIDSDDKCIVDYLGPCFSSIAKDSIDASVVLKARSYVEEQIAHWCQAGNKKLADRYKCVQAYLSQYDCQE